MTTSRAWPALDLHEWVDTRETVHLWTQMIGKVKPAVCPFVNQWWEVGLELDSRGLASGLIPAGDRSFEIALDLIDQRMAISDSDGSSRSIALAPGPVAEFFAAFTAALADLSIVVEIDPVPSEMQNPLAMDQDTAHVAYDGEAATRWWQAMLSYLSPAPESVSEVTVEPEQAGFVEALGEFVLPYDAVRGAPDPDAAALAFFTSAYVGCADRAGWDRAALEGPVPAVARGPR